MMLLPLLLLSLAPTDIMASKYPTCWVRSGECLDQNKGPLEVGVKPQLNPNVVNTSITNVASFDDCATQCLSNSDCRYFTYYANPIPLTQREATNSSGCFLVGFNLHEPCFNMENTCVMLKECLEFDGNCTSCKTGKRPLLDPKVEPLTLVVNGVVDTRDWEELNLPGQYSETTANINELILSNGSTCTLGSVGLVSRFGSTAVAVNGTVLNVGGFSSAVGNGSYLTLCQAYSGGSNWSSTCGGLNTARAFASAVATPANTSAYGSVAYVMGGYSLAAGFMDSVEKFDPTAKSWSVVPTMKLPEKKSHFCLVMSAPDSNGDSFLYAIGGWNMTYLDSVHRIGIDPTTGANTGSGWMQFPKKLNQARSDLACAEVQVDASRSGIMAAGGYSIDGAWLSSVEFLDYEKGEWVPLVYFPSLMQGRHYHGLTTVGMIPQVFGGWNNGSLSNFEYLDSCATPAWKKGSQTLMQAREKFAYVRVPQSFIQSCV